MGRAEGEEFPRWTIPPDLFTQLRSCPELLCWVVQWFQLHLWDPGIRGMEQHLTLVTAGFLPSLVGLVSPRSAESSETRRAPSSDEQNSANHNF